MKLQNLRRAAIAAAFVTLLSPLALSAAAQDKMDKMDKMDHMGNMAHKGQPVVALIRADWCSACQQLEPKLAELMEQYKDRINFVVLDVTTDEKTTQSAATARKLGLSKFFETNKKKTSTVAIFGAKNKLLFRTDHNADRDAFVRAFDDAIAKAGQQG